MAQMRFPGERRPRSLHQVAQPRDRSAEHPADAPIVLPPPPAIRWSLSSYPYPDPAFDDAPAADTEPEPEPKPAPRRRRKGGTPS